MVEAAALAVAAGGSCSGSSSGHSSSILSVTYTKITQCNLLVT